LPYILFLRHLGKLTAGFGLTVIVPSAKMAERPPLRRQVTQHRKIRVSQQCLLTLSPWRERSYLSGCMPIGSVPFRRDTLAMKNASLSGWDAVWQKRTAQGQWSTQDRTEHINVLELRAVHLALRKFLPYLRGMHVLFRSDNTATVFHIKHQGAPNRRGCEMCPWLLLWAAPRLTSLQAMYLPVERNQVVDFLSHYKPPPGKWRLNPEVVHRIWGLFGRAEVDLFASEMSTHCPLLFSQVARGSFQPFP